MPTHDIIDNRSEKLVDHINRMLDSTEYARFAVGYFFLSGLESIAERLDSVKELRPKASFPLEKMPRISFTNLIMQKKPI